MGAIKSICIMYVNLNYESSLIAMLSDYHNVHKCRMSHTLAD